MRFGSALAIYVLFWALAVFVVLPFGVRTADEAGEARVPGQADSAPHRFDAGRFVIRTTIVASIAFAVYYLNYVNGWVTPAMLDISRLVD